MPVEYRIGDALDELATLPAEDAAFIHLDDAWARPKRGGAFGVEYPTHPFEAADADAVAGDPGVTTALTVVDVLEACRRVLRPKGVLAVDVDDYLLPRVLQYVSAEWGACQHLVAHTTLLNSRGDPDCSTPGMYLSTGGYSTVLWFKDAHPGPPPETPTYTAPRQREDYGWGTVKPLKPYRRMVQAFTHDGDRVVVPCAGTAPTAIAAELEHDDPDVVCIDVEPDAKAAYERRRAAELGGQAGLERWA